MRNNLKKLDELQTIDLRIDALRGEKGLLGNDIASLELKVEEAQSAIALKQADLKDLEQVKDDLELSLETESENIVRSEVRLKEIKTQKEYQAVSKEISTAKKLKVELEENILQKIGELEELKAKIATQQEELNALEETIAAQKAEVQGKIDRLDADIAADSSAREAAAKGLPSSLMRRYSMLREQRRGIAVVEARDGSCLGCNMNLPPQVYNSLFRGDEIITCPHCQRVLVLKLEAQNG